MKKIMLFAALICAFCSPVFSQESSRAVRVYYESYLKAPHAKPDQRQEPFAFFEFRTVSAGFEFKTTDKYFQQFGFSFFKKANNEYLTYSDESFSVGVFYYLGRYFKKFSTEKLKTSLGLEIAPYYGTYQRTSANIFLLHDIDETDIGLLFRLEPQVQYLLGHNFSVSAGFPLTVLNLNYNMYKSRFSENTLDGNVAEITIPIWEFYFRLGVKYRF